MTFIYIYTYKPLVYYTIISMKDFLNIEKYSEVPTIKFKYEISFRYDIANAQIIVNKCRGSVFKTTYSKYKVDVDDVISKLQSGPDFYNLQTPEMKYKIIYRILENGDYYIADIQKLEEPPAYTPS